ncbi:MAG: prepilin-type N-terminal cleavage/methylation domain-containing protein [Deltaproteobacteria bacterium]|nr:prepilin-type N-terminal cleavage/methylation domain-containing protein [Deltaproteobacteria bacterium]
MKAFSLVEVMAAAAIFAVGLGAIFTAFGTASQSFEHQRHMTHGIHLAEAKMEELLLRVSSDPELQAGTTFGPNWFDSRGFPSTAACASAVVGMPALSTSCRYRITWSSAPALVPQVRITTVTASWNERELEKRVQFATQRN